MSKEKTVIFAEPTEALSSDLSQYMANKGYGMIKATNLKETLLTLQEQKVDVLVLDAALLEEDCGFISVIKGMVKDLPVIICSETNTPELESEIRKQRIFYYHIKSFGIEDLKMALSNAVNGIPH
ncbi:MAG: response regulator [Thermodesulfobacteriota bacterium]|nr:response regulator [Thermodesulfobacteriota bacterium]